MSDAMEGGLYDPRDGRDSCGVGLVASIGGERSHRIVETALRVLENMAHRGAENGDGRTGDGAGILVQVPHRFIASLGIPVPEPGRYGTGLVFLPRDVALGDRFLELLKAVCQRYAVSVIAVRDVPVDHSVPGPMALEGEPRIVQVFVSSYDSQETLERKLFRIRKIVGNSIAASDIPGRDDFYICSLSTRTMVYKGMLTPRQLRDYYRDLTDPLFESAIALVHSRFSTNTMPAWKLAQPFRMLAHNGEINTIKANRSWMQARESTLDSEDLSDLFPIVQSGMSDSASLDNVFEFLTVCGRTMPAALSILIPESWNDRNPIPDSLKAYYEYNSILMEPWDGPAAVMFTDGTLAGGMLDRNGLRPARYSVTADGTFIMASEAGVIPLRPSDVVETGRLRPGKMLMVDTSSGRILHDAEIKEALASAYPYRDWLEKHRLNLDALSSGRQVGRTVDDYARMLSEFGYNAEDVTKVMEPMVAAGKEPIGSTGFDAPLAIFSDRPQSLFNFFRQMFAQVTNPPIDPIREELVMSITGYIGSVRQSILDPTPAHIKVVKARHPVITNRELDLLRNLRYRGFEAVTLDTTFPAEYGPGDLEKELGRLCSQAEAAVDSGASYIILSDRGVSDSRAPMPSLLALSAVHQHLVSVKKRLQTALVVESGEPREVMHFALLIGYGANVVNPYLAFAVVQEMSESGRVKMDPDAAEASYLKAIDKGLLKIMSKMGIATIRSYRGSCLFEAVGIDRKTAARWFGGTASRACGIGLDDIAAEYLEMHREALAGRDAMADDAGVYSYKKDGERHGWNPAVVKALRAAAQSGSEEDYRRFADLVDRRGFYIRDRLGPRAGTSVPLDEVEPAESLMRRFQTAAISFGAISIEAHETLAEAMNSIGSMSNTGEGGEDPSRSGTPRRSAVKQVASGRFGVTAQYLVDADELQIKVAQGAKPGEGGQLMGFKVDRVIARTRHTIPGITLISPPPHHDIYSIEDLKQLIYDLKCVNPTARVSVKLVSEPGIGTVAAGVAKAGADMILVSGGDGGTGASPLSSLRYAGSPWETGLAEVQQALVSNGLRGRVSVQVDGQMKTGRDIIVAACLGAEEFGFATAPMVAMGCVMCRRCQTNTCPAGIATQDLDLRRRFKGSPRDVVNYWRLMAEDVRSRLSGMGFRSLSEIIGRADLLEILPWDGRASHMDLKPLLHVQDGERRLGSGQPDIVGDVLDRTIIADAADAIATGRPCELDYRLTNVQRSVGAMLSGEIVRRGAHLRDGAVRCDFTGAAGQSFGAFLVEGVTFVLTGIANDYVGKGLSGGRIAIRPGDVVPDGNVIAGNTLLYGATSGELYVAGSVGERFCVRNSGATAVAEGAGDHCCEYMTGGRVVVLGPCGRNFAAGMSAGIAYVYDAEGDFDRHCNMDMVELTLVESAEDVNELRSIVQRHADWTGSPKAKSILAHWDEELPRFVKVMPVGYKLLLEKESERAWAVLGCP